MKVDNNAIVYSKGDITFLSSQEPFDLVDSIEAVIGGSGLQEVVEGVKSIATCPSTKRGPYFFLFFAIMLFDESVFAIEFRIDSFIFRIVEPCEKLLFRFCSCNILFKNVFNVIKYQAEGGDAQMLPLPYTIQQ